MILLISLLIYLTDICIELTSMEEFVFGLGRSFIELMNYLVYYGISLINSIINEAEKY